jgi:hypothetical protein
MYKNSPFPQLNPQLNPSHLIYRLIISHHGAFKSGSPHHPGETHPRHPPGHGPYQRPYHLVESLPLHSQPGSHRRCPDEITHALVPQVRSPPGGAPLGQLRSARRSARRRQRRQQREPPNEPSEWQGQDGNTCSSCEPVQDQWVLEEWVFAAACLMFDRMAVTRDGVHEKIVENRQEATLEDWIEDRLREEKGEDEDEESN